VVLASTWQARMATEREQAAQLIRSSTATAQAVAEATTARETAEVLEANATVTANAEAILQAQRATQETNDLRVKLEELWVASKWDAIVRLLDDNPITAANDDLREKLYAALVNQGQVRLDAGQWILANLEFSRAAELNEGAGIAEAKLTETTALRSAAETQAAPAKAAAAAAAATRRAGAAAMKALCGDEPRQSAWDGMVAPAVGWIKDNLNDPGSYEAVGCTPPKLTDACWLTVCQFRAKNAFGALILNEYSFTIGANGVILAAVRSE